MGVCGGKKVHCLGKPAALSQTAALTRQEEERTDRLKMRHIERKHVRKASGLASSVVPDES